MKTRQTKVVKGKRIRMAIRLINKSDGDISDGNWFIVLPPGVTYVGSSVALAHDGARLDLDPVEIYTKGRLQFWIDVHIESNAPDRLTFHSFLDDYDAYCEAADALTVSPMGYEDLIHSSSYSICHLSYFNKLPLYNTYGTHQLVVQSKGFSPKRLVKRILSSLGQL